MHVHECVHVSFSSFYEHGHALHRENDHDYALHYENDHEYALHRESDHEQRREMQIPR